MLKLTRRVLPMLVLLVSLVLGVFPVVAQDDFAPTFEETECFVPLPEGVVAGEDVICGYVTVPEMHSNPDGPTIRIAVAVIKSPAEGDLAPTLFVDGGPGTSSLSSLPLLAGPYGQPLLAGGRDLIMVEQRGTYFSEPQLTCPAVFDVYREAAIQSLSFEERNDLLLDAYQSCWDRLKNEGIELSAFNSIENAADFPMVAEALGHDDYNIYGVSYGTQVAQHIMRDHPDGIRSVALNAVIPLNGTINVDIPVNAERVFQLLFDRCAANAACQDAYPNLESTFLDTVEVLNATPMQVPVQHPDNVDETITRSVSGDDLVRMLSEAFYPETIPALPQIITAIANGDSSWLASRLALGAGQGTEALGMMYSVICAEDADFTMDEVPTETPIQQAMAAGRPQEFQNVCGLWDVDRLGDTVDEPLVSDIPTLLMAGSFDVITPPSTLDVVAENLSNSYAYTFPGQGHGGMDPCRLMVMLDFFNNPTEAPKTGCIDGLGVQFNVSDSAASQN